MIENTKAVFAKSREKYLEKSVDILCVSAYRMCRDNYKRLDKSERIDPKLLKETCLALKETAALVSGLEKASRGETEMLKIVFEDTESYAE